MKSLSVKLGVMPVIIGFAIFGYVGSVIAQLIWDIFIMPKKALLSCLMILSGRGRER